MANYHTFLAGKHARAPQSGFDVDPVWVHPGLFDWQQVAVRRCLRLGRAALFEDTGLGKSRQILEWCRHVARHTGRKVLLVTPLAVAHQFVGQEAPAIGVEAAYVRSQVDAEARSERIILTNYDMVRHFDLSWFAGLALDEADLLANYTGQLKQLLIARSKGIPYKIVATATPAPNDLLELGNYAEFLELMPSNEMIARFFINDSMHSGRYRLKQHARSDFWRWLTSWAICLGKPSDLGPQYSDEGYILPPLHIHQHDIQLSAEALIESGQMFPGGKQSATQLWRAKHETHEARCELAARLAAEHPEDAWVVWCETDEESALLTRLIPDAVEVRGSHSPEEKEARLRAFSEGRTRIIVTKPRIAGMGLNWQHAHRTVFVSPTFSFKSFYQGLRRLYRFRQQHEVTCHIIISETEENVVSAIQRKQQQHQEIHAEARAAMAANMAEEDATLQLTPVQEDEASGEGWRLLLGDCVERTKEMDTDSADLTIFSPPFSSLYVYSASVADMGNAASDDEFFAHFQFLLPELWRVTKPGRLCVVHCKDLPRYISRDQAAGLYDFPGEIVRAFEGATISDDSRDRWQYHSRVTIWKDPVIERARTNNHGLLHKSFTERAEVCRQGMPDYLLVFRKWTSAEMPDKQIQQRREPGDYIGQAPPRQWTDQRDYSIQVWQRYASPVWFDIDQTDVLNFEIARESEDEKHICPLQLGVIRRCIDLWTNRGDTVFSPFAGVGSEPFVAVQMGRRGVGIELKRSYWQLAVRHLRQAELEASRPTLFDMEALRAA